MSFYGKTKKSYEFKKIVAEKMEKTVNSLLQEMKEITPVDTGDLRDNYELTKKSDTHYSISNDLTYAHQILAVGRVGKLGSEQLPDGILPFVHDFVRNK